MLTYRPQSGRAGRALRSALWIPFLQLALGGCSGCNGCFNCDLGPQDCNLSDSTCLLLCPESTGGGGSGSGLAPGVGGSAGATTTGGGPPGGFSVAGALPDAFTPFDAVPSSSGTTVYVTGVSGDGPAVLACTVDGCVPLPGSPSWTFPVSVALADDATLWVVDASPEAVDDGPELYRTPLGSAATAVDLAGFVPRAVTQAVVHGDMRTYLSGIDASGSASVAFFRGGTGPVQPVYAGDPLVDPAALTVGSKGEVFLVDNLGPGARPAIYRLEKEVATLLVSPVDVGYPSGIAIDVAGQTLTVNVRDSFSGATRLLVTSADGSGHQLLGEGFPDKHTSPRACTAPRRRTSTRSSIPRPPRSSSTADDTISRRAHDL